MKHTKKQQDKIVFNRWTRKTYAAFSSLKKTVHIGVLSVACFGTTMISTPSLAQSIQKDTSSVLTKELKDIVISSEKAIPFQQMGSVVAVIEKKDIENAAVENLQDLLKYVQGVDSRTRGNEGVQADISLKGGTFDQILVLLNGINFTDPQTGHHSLNLPIYIHSIERIEILQGPFVWNSGTTAFCGAINIITQKPYKTGGQIDVSYGDYGTLQLGGVTNMAFKKGFLSLSGGHSESKGFAHNTDFKIDNIYLSGGFFDNEKGNLNFQLGYQQKAFGANSFYSPKYKEQYEETKSIISSVSYNKQWMHWQILSNVYYRLHHDNFKLFRNETPEWYTGHNYHLTNIVGGNFKVAYTSSFGLSTLAIDVRNENILSTGLGDVLSSPKQDIFDAEGIFKYQKSREYISAFLQHEIEKNKWKASLGIMAGGNSDFGIRMYGGASLSYFIRKNLELKYWLQNVYRLPTFTDLYYKSPTQISNPNLRPEEAVSNELSIQWNPNKWTFNVSAFYRYGFMIIDWVKHNKEDHVWHCENASNSVSTGVNAFIEYKIDYLFLKKIKFNYDFLDVKNTTHNYSSLYTNNYVKHQCKFSLDHAIWKSLSASWLLSFQDRAGNYYNYNLNEEVPYHPYFLCNLKIYWTKKQYTLFLEATNLFNTSYLEIENLPQPGRWWKTGFAVRL